MITINDSLDLRSPKPLDDRYAAFSSGTTTPYNSIEEANAAIPKAYRHAGLTVLVINSSGKNVEYWYKDGREDANLILKTYQITVSSTPPANPSINDLWIQI